MYREIAGTDERVRAIPGVRDRRVRATKVRLYFCMLECGYKAPASDSLVLSLKCYRNSNKRLNVEEEFY